MCIYEGKEYIATRAYMAKKLEEDYSPSDGQGRALANLGRVAIRKNRYHLLPIFSSFPDIFSLKHESSIFKISHPTLYVVFP